MIAVLLLALGGGVGAAVRFAVDGLIRARGSVRFPVATVVINVSGSAALGFLTAAAAAHAVTEPWAAALGTGVCGGYTTFSTAMVETVRLAQQRRWTASLLNLLGTTVVCVLAAGAGIWVARAVL